MMEHIGAERQWSSLSGVHTAEEADFMALLLNSNTNPQLMSSSSGTLPPLWSGHHESSSSSPPYNNGSSSYSHYCSLEISNSNLLYTNFNNEQDHHDYCLKNINGQELMISSDENLEEEKVISKSIIPASHNNNKKNNSMMKRPRSNNAENNVKVEKRCNNNKKKQKLVSTKLNNVIKEEEEGNNNNNINGQSCSSYCSSGDDSIDNNGYGSQDQMMIMSPKENNSSSSTFDSQGKTRARRGSATDPQSLYARKRRERINERLRILQNIVPNGTKVDISTMLEEAVQYVKFLQLQIKLLSSDDMWMYAPIAYNGMDIRLDHLRLAI